MGERKTLCIEINELVHIQIYMLFVQNLALFKSLFRGVAFRLSYQVLFFGTGLFMAAITGAENFGVISLMIVNAAAFMIITGLGTDAALIWHGAGHSLAPPKLF